MNVHRCPWWLTYAFDNPLRRLLHDPEKILKPYIKEGARAADLGCGMGYFTPTLAKLVGARGRVQAIDLQPQQLARVRARARRAGVLDRVELVTAEPERLGLTPPVDFVLAFWMVHEVPNAAAFFTEIRNSLAPHATVLIAEPRVHVRWRPFAATLDLARTLGFVAAPVHTIRFSHAAVLTLA
ncbi:MAG: class I SAM-dependent methyltransferase [Deltaproteobacteria bacterium]|nr:class I SAM-dependent methyltransferase [Deltaproteobacteria bacterium]